MPITVIIPPGFASGSDADKKAGGLGAAGAAFLAAGLPEQLADTGAEVLGVVRLDERDIPIAQAEIKAGDVPIPQLAAIGGTIATAVAESLKEDIEPVIAGGSCVALPGVLGGLQQAFGASARIGLVWFDAHGDFNTPKTTRSGMLGGMPVAVSAGLCYGEWREGAGQAVPIPTNRIIMVDVRNLDPEERALIEATDVRVVPVPEPDAELASSPFGKAIADLAASVDHIYLHVDADVLDASLQPNHPTAEPNGPGLDAVTEALRAVFATGKVRAFSVVSVNPTDEDGKTSLESGLAMLRAGVAAWQSHSASAR